MGSNERKLHDRMAPVLGWIRAAVRPATNGGAMVNGALAGALLGLLAQSIRQTPGVLMDLGSSTAPWVMIGFLLAVLASSRVHTTREGLLLAMGAIASYLFAWLIEYHTVFVLREFLSFRDGLREALPWLIAGVPGSLLLGTIAALAHDKGWLGDACLAVPVAWTLPEVLAVQTDKLVYGVVVVIPTAALMAVMIHVVGREREVQGKTVALAGIVLAVLGVALYPVARNFILS